MIEYPSFKFAGFTLRGAVQDDLDLAMAWTIADEDHKHNTLPDFWIENNLIANSFLLLDAIGPVFFFKMVRLKAGRLNSLFPAERAVEIHIQFPPHDQRGGRLRTMQGLAIGFDWLKKILGEQGFDAVYFTSKNQRLISFCVERLGFFQDGITGDQQRLKAFLERRYDSESV